MKVRLLNRSEDETYTKIYEEIFGIPSQSIPERIYVGETDDGAIVGFMAGHTNFDGTFYIEFAGIRPKHRNKGYIKYLKNIMDATGQKGFLCVTENTNVIAMKTLIAIGFLPFGGRFTQDKYYIEWSK